MNSPKKGSIHPKREHKATRTARDYRMQWLKIGLVIGLISMGIAFLGIISFETFCAN